MAICGIIASCEAVPVDEREISRMVSALALRDNWSCEQSTGSEVAFGMTSCTASVSFWESDRIAVVCDADICNQDELHADLTDGSGKSSLACLFAEIYLERGLKFLDCLRGAFSLAIWDYRSKSLLLAVDRFGIKTLCFSSTSAGITFASQPRGILASGRITRQVDVNAFKSYLTYSVVPAPTCVFKGIEKVPPACFTIWQDGTVRTSRYWDIDYSEDLKDSEERLAQEMLIRMREAVDRTSQDVPTQELGCFLSGGTDSSSVVGLLTQVKGHPVNTVSIGFNEERFNELQYAHIAAQHFKSLQIESRLGPEDAYRILPRIVAAYDEPYANSSALATYFCHTLAADRGIKVMLAGDGGDELFGGNESYRTDQVYQLYERIPNSLRRRIVEPIASCISSTTPVFGKIRRYIQWANTANPDRYFRWRLLQCFSAGEVLGPEIAIRDGQDDFLTCARAHYQSARAQSELNRLLYIDVKIVLGDNDIPKVVRTSELAGVTVRFPFLDHPLAEFSGRVPANLKLKGLEKRYLFKRATSDLLPRAILRKRKHGFGLPVGFWLKKDRKFRELAEDILRDPRTYQRGYFRKDFVEHLFAAMGQDGTPFYGDVLYTFLMFELWYRSHAEGKTGAL